MQGAVGGVEAAAGDKRRKKRDPAQQGRVGVRLRTRCRAQKRELVEATVARRSRRVNHRA